MTQSPPAARRTPLAGGPRSTVAALGLDLLAVAVFVLIGRASHDEDPLTGAVTTLWPFAAGVLVGWLVSLPMRRMPEHPSGGTDGVRPTHALSIPRSGVPVWISTVVVGLMLRVLAGQGIETSFAIVTAVVLGVFLLGWRLLAAGLTRRAARRQSRREG